MFLFKEEDENVKINKRTELRIRSSVSLLTSVRLLTGDQKTSFELSAKMSKKKAKINHDNEVCAIRPFGL